MLLFGGLFSSLRVTSVLLGSTVPTHPMAPVSCTGYECQTRCQMVKCLTPVLIYTLHAHTITHKVYLLYINQEHQTVLYEETLDAPARK